MIVQQINYNMGVAEWLCGLLGLCLRVCVCLSVLDLVVVVVVCCDKPISRYCKRCVGGICSVA